MASYDDIRRKLSERMQNASSLVGEAERRQFITQEFVDIRKLYTQHEISHPEYIMLVDRLAAYQSGKYNDYLDMLVGAATMGMLDVVVRQSKTQDVAAQSRQRRQEVTDLTGVQPIQPDEQ